MNLILKISGEILKNENNLVAESKLAEILNIVSTLKKENHSIAIIIGGGNFFRGREHPNMDKVTRDTIGMLGTVINALYIKDYLEKNNINAILSTPFSFPDLIANYSDEKLNENYQKGSVIIFGGGVGKSGYSTDSGLILACDKINAELVVKLTNVDGVYDSDPKINKNAKMIPNLTFAEVLLNNYQIMDKEAIKYAKDHNLKIIVINFNKGHLINKVLNGEKIGTLIMEDR